MFGEIEYKRTAWTESAVGNLQVLCVQAKSLRRGEFCLTGETKRAFSGEKALGFAVRQIFLEPATSLIRVEG